MKTIKFNWMFFLASTMLVFCSACSNGTEEVPVVNKTEVSRTAITVEKTIELTEPGTLQVKLEEAMGDEDVSTLQKLTLSGPFTGTDVQYWKTMLGNLIELDLADAVPTYVEEHNTYKDPNDNDMYLYDNRFGGHMFSFMTKLEKIVFPVTLEYVGHETCHGCSSLIEVVLSDNIENMSHSIFEDCRSLIYVSLPPKITYINSSFFRNCSSLESIEIPEGVVEINWQAFYGCKSLKGIVIPNTVERIYDSAFRGCNLISVHIPSSVTTLEGWVFAENPNLKEVKLLANISNVPYYCFYNCPSLAKVELNPIITKVDAAAFEGCTALKDFTPFKNIKEIYGSAFYKTSLESVDLSNVAILEGGFGQIKQLKSVVLPDTITKMGYGIFEGCEGLEKITLPSSLESISERAFAGTSLKELVIPSKVKMIDNQAFRETKLVNITIPASVKSIGYESFWNIQTLKKVTLNEGLEIIGERALGGNLVTEFNIPSTVTEIGEQAFRGTKIKVLTIPATVTKVGGSLIDDCSDLTALVWNTTAELRDTWGVDRNCYLYLADGSTPCGPNWKNIIIDGVAESVVLCEGGWREDSNRSFNIPIAFKAKKITLERDFGGWTVPGQSSGWETIVLPFTPTKIENETKGIIAPFNSDVKNAKPFWLRSLTAEGFKDVTTFIPNVPYIIALPNHNSYLEEYRLTGKIFFSAENVDIAATPDVLEASVGPDYSLQPTYDYVQAAPQVYALNVNYGIDGYHNGGVFARSSSDVYAFEAYVVPNGRSARSVFEMGTRSSATRTPYTPNKTGIPQIGDM